MSKRVWVDGPMFCNLVEDDKRVLGQALHIILAKAPSKWRAFDNTKMSKRGDTALPIGVFDTVDLAKAAVEKAHETLGEKLGNYVLNFLGGKME